MFRVSCQAVCKYPSRGASMSIAKAFAGVQKSFRMKRMRRFAAAFPLTKTVRILDVGGTSEIWQLLNLSRDQKSDQKVVMINMPRAGSDVNSGNLQHVYGDGCNLPFADQSFDIAFSNSVIEHVGDADAQRRFADEIRRSAKGYWVQTPNRYFPIEPHLLTPFVHLLPRAWAAPIVRRFTVWQFLFRPTEDRRHFYVEHFLADIRLLSAREMQRLFPDAVILRERFLFLTKSLVAYRAQHRDAPHPDTRREAGECAPAESATRKASG